MTKIVESTAALPEIDLREVRRDLADLLVALGAAAGGLSRDEQLHAVADLVRSGSLHAGYLTYLREKLDAVLNEAAAPAPSRH